MIDVLIILAGGVIGFISALVLHFISALFPKDGVFGSRLRGVEFAGGVACIVGLLACFILLGAHWDHSPFTPRYNWQYTPTLVFGSCLGVFLICAVLDGRKTKKHPKKKPDVSPRVSKDSK